MDIPDFPDLPDIPIIGDSDLETTVQLAAPRISYRVQAKRQFVNGLKKQALNELIPKLPPPDTDLYVIGNGAGAEIRHGINPQAFDFGTFIPHVVAMLGNRACTVYVSTWTMNRQHVKTLLQLLDDGAVSRALIATDPYFKRREAAIASELISGLLARNQRYIAFKNHCKIIALSNPSGDTCVITGSANLSAQPRCEQYVLTTAPDVYRFFRDEFFESIYADAQAKTTE